MESRDSPGARLRYLLWYLIGLSLLSLGSFMGYCGWRLFQSQAHFHLGVSLIPFGGLLAALGFTVLWRTIRTRS